MGEFKACPFCKSRAGRIAELEAQLAKMKDDHLYVSLMRDNAEMKAKLAMVARLWLGRGDQFCVKGDVANELDAILSDTLKPLAVVEGEILTNGSDTFIEAELPGYRFDWPADKYTVIIMPKEADDE
jgi:hypothetical protein